MVSSVQPARQAAPRGEAFLESIGAWMRGHRQAVVYGAVALGAVVLVAAWSVWSGRQAEARAADQLSQAQFALESQNLPLAASELARVAENYSGTRAADQAMVLLAKVRLLPGQDEQAVTVLRDFAPSADRRYRAQAFSLLAAAYENLGHAREAAQAFESAAGTALWPFLEGQYLLEAARDWAAAGDTARAIANLERVIRDFEKSGPVVEAKVRLGELTRGARSVGESARNPT
jgi:predicted negative regulator of RcsB-dependent stress response